MSAGYFSESCESEWDTEIGKPGIAIVANAIQFWAIQQNKTATVREAAIAFNCDDEMIRQAVEWHSWMFISGPDDDALKQVIEHEGE